RAVRQAICSDQVADQGASGGKCRNAPLCGAKKDTASHVRRQRIGHRGCSKAALADSRLADQGQGSAPAAWSREQITQGCKLVRPTDNRILIAAGHDVVINVSWSGIQPVHFDGLAQGFAMRRELQRRSAQPGRLGSKADLTRRCFLLQLGGDVHGRAGNIKAVDRVAAALAQTDQAGMNADTKVDGMSARPGRSAMPLNVPSRNAGTIRMILIRARPAEYGNTAIAGIVDDLSPDTLHRAADMIQPVIQK